MNRFTNGVSFKLRAERGSAGEEKEVKGGRRSWRLAKASRVKSIFNFQLDSSKLFGGGGGEWKGTTTAKASGYITKQIAPCIYITNTLH